jgi:hypothetical protein
MDNTEPLSWVDQLIQDLPKAAERTPEELAKAHAFIDDLINQIKTR